MRINILEPGFNNWSGLGSGQTKPSEREAQKIKWTLFLCPNPNLLRADSVHQIGRLPNYF